MIIKIFIRCHVASWGSTYLANQTVLFNTYIYIRCSVYTNDGGSSKLTCPFFCYNKDNLEV